MRIFLGAMEFSCKPMQLRAIPGGFVQIHAKPLNMIGFSCLPIGRSYQWHADHARCLAALRDVVALTGVLLAGANLSCGCQQLKSTAPSQIAVI